MNVKAVLILIITIVLFTTGCTKNADSSIQEPDVMQVRNICNLATMECYYHNVAKSEKKGNLLQRDRTFWIEYTGVVTLGIDMTKVTMKIDGVNVDITIPKAEILSISIDNKTLDENSYISSEDGIWKNRITADEQTESIKKAQEEMKNQVNKNTSLFLNAQNRAKTLIENYINQLGDAVGIKYNISWKYLDNSGSSQETDSTEEE